MTFSKLIVASTFIITLVIIVLVVSPSLGSTMLMKSKISLIQLSYAEIMGVVVGAGMQHDIAYIKPIENKTSSPSLPLVKPVQGTLVETERVVNEGGGSKKPSDFIITVHGNNPLSQFLSR